MPSTDSLLQLRSNAPGLPGPYLQENLAPYQLLDAMGKARPRSILAIGGRVKSQYLAREFSTTLDHHETPSVALTSLDHKTIWLDCELHFHQMPRIKAKSSIAGCSRLHFLNSAAARVAKIAYPIYTDVLALFSDIILIFVPDFGGLPQVVDFLGNWIKSSMAKGPQAYSRIILLHREVVADKEVNSLVLAKLASYLRVSCPTEAYSSKDLTDMMNQCFRIHNLPLQSGHRQWLFSEVAVAFRDRRRRGLHFNAHHFKWLLQAGISQYAEQPSVPFNPISSSRLQYLLPERLGDCLATFLGGVKNISGSEIGLVASALVMDAYPPGMHSFLPDTLFERLYAGPAKECEKLIKLPGLALSIKRDFITLAGENRETGVGPAQTHLGRVQGNPTMRCTYHESICAFCIIRAPMFTLDCIFFVLTAFLQGWSLSDCRYHLKSITGIRTWRDTIRFGKGLSFDLGEIKHTNNILVCLTLKKKVFKNTESSIESTNLYYQGSEPQLIKTALCTEESMQNCQNNQPFIRELQIKASSNTTQIRALIDGSDGKKHSISKCPYQIIQLIEDQGLDCVFGKRNQKQYGETQGNISTTVTLAQMELRKLLDSLT
ncbi:hypothetical protein B0J13DRAFT_455740 [Dactylonectria estremocensis]|uniref:Uncharacterized protein n=1 Tax=Dactylonectria estremocensis TaxID=1079267 RepID=A0A9P9ILC3_9HYPO|nr:hypothetical protein B0J13DRAFT_455740 [Dactylonectria estremocensis]